MPGKDTRGEYVYVPAPEGGALLDLEGHPIVDHDLFDVKDVLAEQFARWKHRLRDDAGALAAKEKEYRTILTHLPGRDTIAEAFIAFAEEQGLSFWTEDED